MADHVRTLPGWTSVLAVVAHPDDESFGLGAVLDAFGRAGTAVSVLCLTRGEASTLGTAAGLGDVRAAELRSAADVLGVGSVAVLDHPDGTLGDTAVEALTGDVLTHVKASGADGLLVFDPSGVTGHPDHVAATAAALAAARAADLPVLGWTLPRAVAERLNDELGTTFTGHDPDDIDVVIPVERDHQRSASLEHASQAIPSSLLWRRLELLHDEEHLRWLTDRPLVQVSHGTGDQFTIRIRNHVLSVDQPVDAGGDDTAPTPTELFVASLASCVGFYAHRYLRRHRLDANGLTVEASYHLASKPARVDRIGITIKLGTALPPERRDPFLAVVHHCTVHNSITTPPEISIELRAADR